MRPNQWITRAGIGSPDTGKFATALRVSPPQSSAMSSTSSGASNLPTASEFGVERDGAAPAMRPR